MKKIEAIKGYKVFNPDFTCNGFQYAENKLFKFSGKLEMCKSGFHFCEKASDCFSYYSFDPQNIVCEVESRGNIIKHSEDSKIVTDAIFIGKRLLWGNVLKVANGGNNNTGYANSGDNNSGHSNSGYSNSGYSNSGNWNSGNSNSGDWNSGNWNSGYSNSGYRNSGNWNSGNSNSGNRNSGNRNSGYSNSGNWNSGNSNSGNSNSGDSNSGDRNSGNWNSGYSNSGNRNSGNSNSGYSNSGNRNSGNWNSGDSNSGNWNSGDSNSGDSNSGYRNSGAFCMEDNPFIYIFDKPTEIKVRDWENSKAISLMHRLFENTIFIEEWLMTDEEKENHPSYKTTGGYLKTKTMHEAWADMWNNLKDDEKEVFLKLPNFDADKFKIITGIEVK